jgi:hypothetical protein
MLGWHVWYTGGQSHFGVISKLTGILKSIPWYIPYHPPADHLQKLQRGRCGRAASSHPFGDQTQTAHLRKHTWVQPLLSEMWSLGAVFSTSEQDPVILHKAGNFDIEEGTYHWVHKKGWDTKLNPVQLIHGTICRNKVEYSEFQG